METALRDFLDWRPKCDWNLGGVVVKSAVPDPDLNPFHQPTLGASPFFPGEGFGAELEEVLERAARVVGQASVTVASKEVAAAAAKEFLAPGAEPIKDRVTGACKGWKSENGSRVVIDSHVDQVGEHMNS